MPRKVAPRIIEAAFQGTRPINSQELVKIPHRFCSRGRGFLARHRREMLAENDLHSSADPIQSFHWMGGHHESCSSNVTHSLVQISAGPHRLLRHRKIIPIDVRSVLNLRPAAPSGTCRYPGSQCIRASSEVPIGEQFRPFTYHHIVHRPPATGSLRRELTLPMQSSRLYAMPSCRFGARPRRARRPGELPGDCAARANTPRRSSNGRRHRSLVRAQVPTPFCTRALGQLSSSLTECLSSIATASTAGKRWDHLRERRHPK